MSAAHIQERIRRAETTRMFESDFFEWFSRVHPSAPFIAWVPLAGLMLYRSVHRGDPGLVAIAGLFVAGVVAWTLSEYVLHRYVFHWMRDTPRGRRIHFLLHGVHHDFPNDKDRLVMPLGISAPLAVVFYALYTAFFGVTIGEPFYAGFVVGYLLYDGTHYAVHHFRWSSRIFKWLRRHHMTHHFADHEGGFGVSSPLWDLVFRTMPQPKRRAAASAGV